MFKILVVDDEAIIRKGIVLGVDWASMDCIVVGEAANGLEGIQAVKQYNPNIIIADVRMPYMDGIQMLTRLRQELVGAITRIRQKEQEQTILAPQSVLPLTKGDKSKYVLKALQYIADHYMDDDISITSIASHLSVSESHLSHVFKKETSYTVIGYLTQYRMHMAMKLLTDHRYKVYEVAEMTGYRDLAYFGQMFKKTVGISPSEYRDRC